MMPKVRKKIPLGSRIDPNHPLLTEEEIAKLELEDEVFTQRCRDIFERVYPELIKDYYNWAIMIEPVLLVDSLS